uniref:Reticulon-like protein n=2 Tax=Salix viminalis TaxID=40686 RepID=A0A6N2L3A8_SALVM
MGDSVTAPRISVHEALGGGQCFLADVLLWKRWYASIGVLVSATTLWILFERAGYNSSSFVANVLFLLVFILFFWAKSASLLNRLLPPLPKLEIPEEIVAKAAGVIHVYAIHALSIAREIVIDKNLKAFLQFVSCLWAASYIGSLCNFLTLVYIGVLLILSAPLMFDKHQHRIDEKLCLAHKIIQAQYMKMDDAVLKKIPLPSNKEKKTQYSLSYISSFCNKLKS